MQERALELRVGLVLLCALAVLGVFVMLLGDFRLKSGLTINVDYNFSGAIQQGAPVKISGIKVGRVADLLFMGGQLTEKGEPIHVRLVLTLEERARPVLKENTEFFVNTQGLLGENYVEIVPHGGESPPIQAGATVRGVDPARFDLLFARLYEFLDSVSELMKNDKGTFVDLMRSVGSLASTLDNALKANDEDLSRTIKNAAAATDRASQVLDSMKTALGDGKSLARTLENVDEGSAVLKRELPETMKKLQHALDQVNRLGDALGDVDRAKVNTALQNATSALEEASAMLKDARAITKRVKGGQGTIGLLVQDDEIYDDLKELLRDLKQHPWKMIWKD
jgi:phospholipid/cholesterol/gamma-HCH transport system substrate-binding protein